MKTFLASAVPACVLYLWLTAGSGDVLLAWSGSELVFAVVLSALTGLLTLQHVGHRATGNILEPKRWVASVLYMFGPFMLELTKANLDVAYRVITGRIRPGIIRVKSGMKNDVSLLYLANSITLTPGTLTVAVDEETNDLFVHKINLAPGEENKEFFDARDLFTQDCPAMIRRIAE